MAQDLGYGSEFLSGLQPSGFAREASASKLTYTAVGRVWSLTGCWLEATLGSVPCMSPHRAAHNMAAGFS